MSNSNTAEQFFWTDELVMEFAKGAITVQNSIPHEVSLYNGIHHFKKEHSKKEEPKRDWEILSFKQDSDVTDLWTKFSHGWCRTNNYGQPITQAYGDSEILKNQLYKIHSVKRLSDGEVFTVGDVVDGIQDENRTIIGFEVADDWVSGMVVYFDTEKKEGIAFSSIKKSTLPSEQQPVERLYEVGDVVIHKAGGLPMTVNGYKNKDEVKTVWLDKDKIKYGVFNELVLKPHEPSSEKSQPKEQSPEPIKVPHLSLMHDLPQWLQMYRFTITKEIDKNKLKLVAQAIENALNGKEEGNEVIWKWFEKNSSSKWYTEDELLEAQHKAFYAAHEMDYTEIPDKPIRHKYPTFTDYIESLKKDKK